MSVNWMWLGRSKAGMNCRIIIIHINKYVTWGPGLSEAASVIIPVAEVVIVSMGVHPPLPRVVLWPPLALLPLLEPRHCAHNLLKQYVANISYLSRYFLIEKSDSGKIVEPAWNTGSVLMVGGMSEGAAPASVTSPATVSTSSNMISGPATISVSSFSRIRKVIRLISVVGWK